MIHATVPCRAARQIAAMRSAGTFDDPANKLIVERLFREWKIDIDRRRQLRYNTAK